jgi:hypothetical protein
MKSRGRGRNRSKTRTGKQKDIYGIKRRMMGKRDTNADTDDP